MTAWAGLVMAAALLQTGSPPAQPMTTIAMGAHSGVESPRRVVARTEAEWQALWREHAPNQPAPAVDFTRDMVVGVFMGSRPTGGFGVQITSMRRDRDSLIVEYRETRPGRGAITAQVITSPFHLAAIPRFAGEVTFQEVQPEK